MQAMHGSVVPGPRRCRRLIGCLIALVAVSAMVMPSIASAAKKPPPPTSTYLALGDSLAFGYSQQLYNECQTKGDPATCFENGYANVYLKGLKSPTTRLINDGCPGETTESLIGNNPTLLGTLNAVLKGAWEKEGSPGGTYDPVTGESPCLYGYVWTAFHLKGKGGPLHNSYGAGKSNFEFETDPKNHPGEKQVVIPNVASQLENAMATIKAGSEPGGIPVTNVTLNIGANDELHTLGAVEVEVKAIITGKAVAAAEAELKHEIEQRIGKRVAEEAKPECEAKFGEEVEKGEASPSEGEQKVGECIGKKVKQYEGEDYASHNYKKEVEEKAGAYAAAHQFEFGEEGEKLFAEKINAKLPSLVAQINKNLAAILFALRDGGEYGLGGVNYTGKITFQAGYNPFGKQFNLAYEGDKFVEEHGGLAGPYAVDYGRCAVHGKTQTEEEENVKNGCLAAALHIGFNTIAGIVNNYTYITAHNKFAACVADPLPRFNPQNEKKPLQEPERLTKWTNMQNVTTTEIESKIVPNGPDIHPTPAGYKELASEMLSEAKTTCHTEGLPGF